MPKFPESAFAHRWLDPLARTGVGAEIGGSAHNQWGIPNLVNIDYTDDTQTPYKLEELRICGEMLKVDLVREGDDLWGTPDSAFDFLINSHVIEHMPDLIKAVLEWRRVVRPGGLVLFVVPDRDKGHAADAATPYTTISHIFKDFLEKATVETHPVADGHGVRGHYHQFNYQLFLDIMGTFFDGRLALRDSLPVDDKVGNGFMCIYEVVKDARP